MKLSPPLTVLAITIIGVAVGTATAPVPAKPSTSTVKISSATYDQLKVIASTLPSQNGQKITVSKVIETLTSKASVE